MLTQALRVAGCRSDRGLGSQSVQREKMVGRSNWSVRTRLDCGPRRGLAAFNPVTALIVTVVVMTSTIAGSWCISAGKCNDRRLTGSRFVRVAVTGSE